MKHIYGPVPSRRLGYSLGVDVVPYKVCSLNCIYCQLGRTTLLTIERGEYVSPSDIIKEIQSFLKKNKKIDHITFSGSGEPALNLGIGEMIKGVKEITSIPVAVLTNGTLLFKKDVQLAFSNADIVIPSLDSATSKGFLKINRPHSSLKINKIIEGIAKFRSAYKGKLWLEIMLVKNFNDTPQELEALKEAVRCINPDKIHLNTVVRPPAEDFAEPLSIEELEKIKKFFGEKAEIIVSFKKRRREYNVELKYAIVETVKRRPMTVENIASVLGVSPNQIIKCVEKLVAVNKIKEIRYKDKIFYGKSKI